MGEEPSEVLTELGKDVFTYFGLGCRNVAKIFVPEEYDFTKLLDSWTPYKEIIHHHKYANNYDYQKSILLVNQTPFLTQVLYCLRRARTSYLLSQYYFLSATSIRPIFNKNSIAFRKTTVCSFS